MGTRADRDLADPDVAGLVFIAEMYALQVDQLAELLGLNGPQARALVRRWRERGLAATASLGPGPPWVWLTRSGLTACGTHYAATPPALARLAHIRAVTAVRLAMEAVPAFRDADAHWRSERHLRARIGGRLAARDHLPDAEVHWPDGACVAWAGECWAVEAERTAKTLVRTTAIMGELLSRTGDYGCPPAQARVPGARLRHDRVLYLCSPAALGTVLRARSSLGRLRTRVEVYDLPAGAQVPS